MRLEVLVRRGLVISTWPLIVGALLAQAPTLPELAQLHRRTDARPLYMSRVVERVVLPLGELVRKADLILEGSVTPRRTYLVEHQQWLYTEYEVTPTRVILEARPRTQQRQPGPRPILVEQSGGRAVFNGVEVVAQDGELALLPVNQPLVLFLSYNAKDDTYQILDSVGAFTVKDSRIAPLLKSHVAEAEFSGVEHGRFIKDIQREVEAGGGKR